MFTYELVGIAILVVQLLIILIALVAASYYDLKKGIIPVEITLTLCVIGFFSSLFPDLYWKIIMAAMFLVIATPLYYKKVLGGGDIKLIVGLIMMLPLMFTTPNFYLLFGLFSCIAGLALYALFKYVLKNEKLVEEASIRFAPALLIGWVVATAITLVGLLWV